MEGSKIEWTEDTLTPITTVEGVPFCTRISDGCRFCYAEIMARRIAGIKHGKFEPYTKRKEGNYPELMLHRDKLAGLKLKQRPRKIFVSSMTDIFGEFVPDEWIFEILDAMYAAPQHIFQILTKRAENSYRTILLWLAKKGIKELPEYMWMGMSVEDQKNADLRIPVLLKIPAVIRWLSMEPLIGSVDMKQWLPEGRKAVDIYGIPFIAPKYFMAHCNKCGWIGSSELMKVTHYEDDSETYCPKCHNTDPEDIEAKIKWIVVGGESGNSKNLRPMHPDWVKEIQKQCEMTDTAFLFKQWGSWGYLPGIRNAAEKGQIVWTASGEEKIMTTDPTAVVMQKMGKKVAGRLLDGKEYNGYPEL